MTEQPPAAVTEDLHRLKGALDAAIPVRSASNLLVGTWNIRALGDLTAKWLAGPKDSPKRDWHAIACLAAAISRFDVVAVQESRRNPAALKRLLASLGPDWQAIVSDVTEGGASNGERLAFLYDSTRVRPAGLVGEIVLPPAGDDPERQFARTPYTASFTRGGVEFTLASMHILWGKTLPSGSRKSPRSPNGCTTGRSGRTTGTRTSWCSATSTSPGSGTRSTKRSSPRACGRRLS